MADAKDAGSVVSTVAVKGDVRVAQLVALRVVLMAVKWG